MVLKEVNSRKNILKKSEILIKNNLTQNLVIIHIQLLFLFIKFFFLRDIDTIKTNFWQMMLIQGFNKTFFKFIVLYKKKRTLKLL